MCIRVYTYVYACMYEHEYTYIREIYRAKVSCAYENCKYMTGVQPLKRSFIAMCVIDPLRHGDEFSSHAIPSSYALRVSGI